MIIKTDSMLIVNQILGAWRCKQAHLRPLRARVRELLSQTQSLITWIPREENEKADAMSRIALAEANKELKDR